MKFCINCGQQLEPGTVFCPNCGTRQPEESTSVQQPNVNQSLGTPSGQSTNNGGGVSDKAQQIKQQFEQFQQENAGDVNNQTELGFVGSCKYVFAHWNDFSTPESRRSVYWWFTLGYMLIIAVFVILAAALSVIPVLGVLITIILGLVDIAVLIAYLSAMARRMIFLNKSPWLLLLAFVPVVGGFILLYYMLTES